MTTGPDEPESEATPETPAETPQAGRVVRTKQLVRKALGRLSGFSWRRDWADDDPDKKVVARVRPTTKHEQAGMSIKVRIALIGGTLLLIGFGVWIGTRLASKEPIVPDSLF